MYGILRQINDTKTSLSTNLKILIGKTKLTPLLFYAVEVFGNSDATSQHKLLVAFNNVARYICSNPKILNMTTPNKSSVAKLGTVPGAQ